MAVTLRRHFENTRTEADCQAWLKINGLLAKTMDCHRCNQPMIEEPYHRLVNDGRQWRCRNRQCRSSSSIRKYSFFQHTRLPFAVVADLMFYWAIDMPVGEATFHAEVTTNTGCQWYHYFRDVCSTDLMTNPTMIGGSNVVVQIDDTVVVKAQPSRGVLPQWLIGGAEIGSDNFFMELVTSRDAATVVPVIQRHVLPGTTVWTDNCKMYEGLSDLGYVHSTIGIGYTRHFVDPETGVHTNNIKARWAAFKAVLKKKSGVDRRLIPEYLDEYMWRKKRDRCNIFTDLVSAINKQYRV